MSSIPNTTDPAVTYLADFTLTAMPLDDGEQQDLHVAVEHRLDGESLIALWQEAGDGTNLELTSGEARRIGEAMIAAANTVDGDEVVEGEPAVVTKVCGAELALRNLNAYVEHARAVIAAADSSGAR